MRPASQSDVRSAMINSSRGEAARMNFLAGYDDIAWADLEYLGWRDPKAPQRGYMVAWQDERLTGVALRAPEGVSNKTVMCALCRSTHSGGGVALFVARRAGAAGRNDNTVGTYICADLACSRYARLAAPTAAVWPAPGIDVDQRLVDLQRRTGMFFDRVRG